MNELSHRTIEANGLSFAAHAVLRGAATTWLVGSSRSERAARSVGVTGFLDYRRGDCAAPGKAVPIKSARPAAADNASPREVETPINFLPGSKAGVFDVAGMLAGLARARSSR